MRRQIYDLRPVVRVFATAADEIDSETHRLVSNEVLARIQSGLTSRGFDVERGKKKHQKIHVPVLFGRQGRPEKSFEADAYSKSAQMVLEVEHELIQLIDTGSDGVRWPSKIVGRLRYLQGAVATAD